MIETTIPEIDVSDLMARVRTKFEQTRPISPQSKLPELPVLADLPPTILPNPVIPPHEKILRALQGAREATTVSRWVPKVFRGLFRRQGSFNREALRTIESLVRTNEQLADRLRHLTACVEVQDHAIRHLADLRRADGQWMQEVAHVQREDEAWMGRAQQLLSAMAEHRRTVLRNTKAMAAKITAIEEKLETISPLREEVGRLGAQVVSFEQSKGETSGRVDDLARGAEAITQRIGAIDQQAAAFEQRIEALRDEVATLARQREHLSAETKSVQTDHAGLADFYRLLRSEFEGVAEHLRHIQVQADKVEGAVQHLQHDLAGRADGNQQSDERLTAGSAQWAALRNNVESVEQRQTSDSAFIKAELSRQSELVHRLIGRAAGSPKDTRPAGAELSEAAAHRLDAFYFSFENRFRGSRAEIKHRFRYYLPFLKKYRAGTKARPVVDVGCGRGEWLELLREQKLTARGVDFNETMIDQCKQRKLKAVQADALEFLRGLPDNSQSAVTGFHIIEHLPFETMIDLISESFRVLQPGGLAIFESPNCKNLSVGACYFYMDPTHRHPVFPETAHFILENRGFERVTLEYLCPMEINDLAELDSMPGYLRDLLYGPRDFSVIGYKPIAN